MKWMFLTLHGNQRENTKDIVFANFDSRIQILAPRKNQPKKRGKKQESELAFGDGFDLESNDESLDAKSRLKSGINKYIFPSALIPLCRKEQRSSNKLVYKNLRDKKRKVWGKNRAFSVLNSNVFCGILDNFLVFSKGQ
jgi:uncharacterized protein with ParB-like and HNH nuclease domain